MSLAIERGDGRAQVLGVLGMLGMIVLVVWLPTSIAWGQTDPDDYASPGEWIFLAVLTTIGTALILLFIVVCHQFSNPHTLRAGMSAVVTVQLR